MKDRLRRAAQFGLTALQIREQKPINYAPPPVGSQMWLCPNCESLHTNEPVNMTTYRCACSWHGDRHELCRGDLSCLTTT
jgi:hypothetical protein